MSKVWIPDRSEKVPPFTEELRRLGVQLGAVGLRSVPKGPRSASATSLEEVVPGQVVETPYGPCFVVETRYHLEYTHGGFPLAELPARECPTPHLAHLTGDRRVAEQDFTSAIFFDIETTGLGIGAGMYAFMVGFGTFEKDGFCLRQYFLRDYHEEEALLYLLHQHMQNFSWWVSFNGRNFDLPILQARFTCGRQEMPLAEAPHLDLLYPARRLWRQRLKSCALSSLEAGVLGVAREGDVPGWLVPELYFDYLRYGEVQPLRQVFLHNALDILSLVALTAKADAMLRNPFGQEADHAIDLYSLGMVFESLGERHTAQCAYEKALQKRLPPEVQEQALRRLSLLYKRSGQAERAVHIWHTLQEKNKAEAYVELAKYYEHQQHDYATAAKLVSEALALDNLSAKGDCSPQALKARLARLKKKLGEGGLPMPHIESYSFGRITIDGKTYTADVLILPDGVRPGWWRKEGHKLHQEDLTEVIEARPQVLVIGTGNVGLMQVPQEVLDYLATHGIRAEVERTAAACKRYNELAQSERVAAALHLTC
ncbi:MAG: ribonuclease H-like domain-containing protein [Chloroflexi bacterium]|nr:ribonuclease H-like domain-containing protein [Chloroflexota bacterium]